MTDTAPNQASTGSATVIPLSGALGAEVVGYDLRAALDDPTTVIELLAEHCVVAFRDQTLDHDAHHELTIALGGHGETPFLRDLPDYPGMVAVVKEADEPSSYNFGGSWHSDWSFQTAPPAYTILRANDIPPYGGDTMWSSSHLAYDTLSDGLKDTLGQLNIVHSAGWSYAADGVLARTAKGRTMTIDTTDDALAEHVHPAVVAHPISGRACLFLNATYVVRIDGWTQAESKPLLHFLYEHATRSQFTCRLRWQPGTVTLWDNRSTQHLALDDYAGFRRELFRTTTAGVPLERYSQ